MLPPFGNTKGCQTRLPCKFDLWHSASIPVFLLHRIVFRNLIFGQKFQFQINFEHRTCHATLCFLPLVWPRAARLLPNYDLWHSASIPVFLHHRIAFEDTRRRQKKMLLSKNKTETGSNCPIELGALRGVQSRIWYKKTIKDQLQIMTFSGKRIVIIEYYRK